MARKYKDTLERCGGFKVVEKLCEMLDLFGGVRWSLEIKLTSRDANLNLNKRHLT